jgi:hypothetical protein
MTTLEDAGPPAEETAADDPAAARRTRQLSADPTDEATYVAGLVASARQATGCSCEELLAAGYALRQWMQRRSLAEQQAWSRGARCPHVTLIDGLAGAEFTGTGAARAWYSLVAVLRRLVLRGKSRVPVINDYVIDWIEENTIYLA